MSMGEEPRADRQVANMAYDLRRPCDDCPFVKASPWHEGIAAGAMKCVKTMERHRFAHSCHNTDPDADCATAKHYKGPLQHCRGVLIMMCKTGDGWDLQLPFMQAAEAGKLDLEELSAAADRDTECFTLVEWLEFQAAGGERKFARARNRRRNKRPGLRRMKGAK